MKCIQESVRTGDIEEVARHLAQGADVDERDDRGQTPLMLAVTSADATTEMMRLLLAHGADINAVKAGAQTEASDEVEDIDTGYSVLALAVHESTLEKVELLIEHGVDVRYQRKSGYDVLIDAMHGWARTEKEPLLPLLDILVTYGAPLNGESDWGESALSVASHIPRFDVVRRLLELGADEHVLKWTELMHAIALGSEAEVDRLLRAGADLSAKDRWGRTPWLLSLVTGDLEKARLLLRAGADVNESGHCGETALMYAIESEQVEILSWLIEQRAALDAKDDFGATALMKASERGATEFVRRLLEAGADVHLTDAAEGRGTNTKEVLKEITLDINDSIASGTLDIERLGLGAFDLDELSDSLDALSGEAAIAKAANVETVRLLVAAGADFAEISDEVRAELTGLETDGAVVCSSEEYFEAKHRRFGTMNPEVMKIPFWQAMVRSGATAYTARAAIGDEKNYDDDAVWCYHRFGRSFTELHDGRIIEIGGEHEDYYDTDFCIYNDVFVHHGGGRFDILGYPEAVLPPTDFHSATLVGRGIYIIGCLGYPEDRHSGETPVYRLDCETLSIEAVPTLGEKPGWIYSHKAIYSAFESGPKAIRVFGGSIFNTVGGQEEYNDNTESYILNLETMNWSREPVRAAGARTSGASRDR